MRLKTCLLAVAWGTLVSPLAWADVASNCVSKRINPKLGTMLFNICTSTIEVAWCISKPGSPYECSKFDNVATLKPDGHITLEGSRVKFAACGGANTIHPALKGLTFKCDPEKPTDKSSSGSPLIY